MKKENIFTVTCVGMPDRNLPKYMFKACEYVRNVSKRKRVWKVRLHNQSAN